MIELENSTQLNSNSCTQEICSNDTYPYVVKVDGKKILTTIFFNNRRIIINPS